MSTKPTPTPWKVIGNAIFDAKGKEVFCSHFSDHIREVDQENLELAKRCVNSMPAVVEALELCIEFINDAHIVDAQWTWLPIENARAALALAKGE